MTEPSQFYNTISEEGQELALSRAKVGKQGLVVLAFFQRTGKEWRPSDVHAHILKDGPITSVRRAITDLTSAGLLEKTDRKARGPWGKWEHYWRLAKPKGQGKLF